MRYNVQYQILRVCSGEFLGPDRRIRLGNRNGAKTEGGSSQGTGTAARAVVGKGGQTAHQFGVGCVVLQKRRKGILLFRFMRG